MELAELVAPPAWMRDALCPEYPHLMWFPDRGASRVEQIRVCARCLVVRECREYAVANQIDDGIWGGLTKAERQRMRAAEREAAEREAA